MLGLVGESGVRGELISGIEIGVGVGLRGMLWREKLKEGGRLDVVSCTGVGS